MTMELQLFLSESQSGGKEIACGSISMGFSVLCGGNTVFLCKGSGEVGMIVKAAVSGNFNNVQVRFDQLARGKLQPVIDQIGRKTHAGQLSEQPHKMVSEKPHSEETSLIEISLE